MYMHVLYLKILVTYCVCSMNILLAYVYTLTLKYNTGHICNLFQCELVDPQQCSLLLWKFSIAIIIILLLIVSPVQRYL